MAVKSKFPFSFPAASLSQIRPLNTETVFAVYRLRRRRRRVSGFHRYHRYCNYRHHFLRAGPMFFCKSMNFLAIELL